MLSLQQRFERLDSLLNTLDGMLNDIPYGRGDYFDLLNMIRSELHMIKKHMPSSVEQ